MTGTVGLLETTGLTPAMVAIDSMLKAAAVRLFQLELNDLSGVCVKITGATAGTETLSHLCRLAFFRAARRARRWPRHSAVLR